MFDIDKCFDMVNNRMQMHPNYPCIDTEFWIPMSQELAKDEEKAIEFVKHLSKDEFEHVSECLEDIVQITNSKNIIKAFEKIAIEKGANIDSDIKHAYEWLD